MTAHWFGPGGAKAKGAGHPLLFQFDPAADFEDWPDGGGYPKRFMQLAYGTLGVTDPNRVLHLCSGSVRVGITVDIRAETNPRIVADCRNVPLPDESQDWIMADPPYSKEYARNLYGTEDSYPAPGQILLEACRLLKPFGRVGILHFMVPLVRKPLRLVRVYGITTGCGYAIRAWSVFEKAQAGLFGACDDRNARADGKTAS